MASRALLLVRCLGRFCIANRTALLLIAGLFVVSVAAIPRYLLPVHATGYTGGPGLVCLMDPSTAPGPPTNPCPSTGYTFTGPYPSTPQIAPTQIKIGVFINGSNTLNGFDITLKSNNTSVLIPDDYDLTGNLLGATTAEACINGIGSGCEATDVYGTIHIAAIGNVIAPPVTGLLFISIWNIVGNSSTLGFGVGFQIGCSGTSVGPDVCVTIVNGSSSPVVESVQGGTTFENPAPLSVPWIALTSTPSATTISVGRGTVLSVDVSAVAENGWPGFSTDLVSFSSQITPGFTPPTFSVSSCSTGGTECNTNATLYTATAGSYVVYILGNYTAVDLNATTGSGTGLTDTLVGAIRFNVNVRDAVWTINGGLATTAQTVFYAKGGFSISNTFTSVNGYSGTLTLSQHVCSVGTTGYACPALPAPFILPANGAVTKLINFTATTPAYGRILYADSLAATGLLTVTGATITTLISGFSMAPNSMSVSLSGGVMSGQIGVTLTSLGATSFKFAGTVMVSSSVSPTGPTVTCSPISLILTAGGTATTTCSFSSSGLAAYSITISGTGGADIANQTIIPADDFVSSSLFQGLNITTTGGLLVNTSASTVAGTAMVTVTNSTTGQLVSTDNYNITGVPLYNQMNGQITHIVLNIPASPYTLSADLTQIVQAGRAATTAFVTRRINISGGVQVNINDLTVVQSDFNAVQGSPAYNPVADLAVHGIVDVNDVTIAQTFFNAPVFY
jgi:hypothetical protein